SGLKLETLRKMAMMTGHRDIYKYSKVELLNVLEKEGF
ncbi:unnamed protein product, partial [marine sediment metagenome]